MNDGTFDWAPIRRVEVDLEFRKYDEGPSQILCPGADYVDENGEVTDIITWPGTVTGAILRDEQDGGKSLLSDKSIENPCCHTTKSFLRLMSSYRLLAS